MALDPQDPQQRRQFGQWAEELAADFLRRRGLRILFRNYRCPSGELDLIARDGNVIVFVEVRATASGEPLRPALSIDEKKERRLWRLAHYFLAQHHLLGVMARFDVVLVVTAKADNENSPDWPAGTVVEEIAHSPGRIWLVHYPNAWRWSWSAN
jgi:putative endonuclease